MTNADLERELQKLQGNVASAFAPTWWMLHELHQRRIELQSLLTIAMDDTSDFFDPRLNDGGKGLAPRSVCAQLPPGLIGQGEIQPRIAKVLPLSEAGQAQALLQSAKLAGKIVLRP